MKKWLALMLVCAPVWAQEKHLLVLGGGSEPKDLPTTIFDSDLKVLGQFARSNPSWKPDVYFNGGHATTEGIIREEFGSFDQSKQSFTASAFNHAIAEYEKKLTSGEIKSGDQLLIHVDTHGATRSPGIEKTHGIGTADGTLTNYDTLGGNTESMDRLIKLTELAKQKGVKLAIIDLSCHSGNSIPLANAGTCVISGTGPNHYGYGGGGSTFAGRFNSALGSGKSLEQVFLEARRDYYDTSFPMISSPQGMDIQQRLYTAMTPYLYNYDPLHDKQTNYLEEEVADPNVCRAEDQFAQLNRTIEDVLSVTQNQSGAAQAVGELKSSLREYYEYLSSIRSEMREAGFGLANEEYEFCVDIKADPSKHVKKDRKCMKYRLRNLLTFNFDSTISYFQGQMNNSTGQQRAEYLATIQYVNMAREKRNQMVALHPKLTDLKKFWDEFPDRQQKSYAMASKVSRAQQKVYDLMYQQSTAGGANPCKDFVL